MPTGRMPVKLTDAQIEEIGRELDKMRHEVIESRGDRDRRYIRNVIKTQRGLALGGRVIILASILFLPAWGHGLASYTIFLSLLVFGAFCLGIAKIIENMEIAHNVMHAQWDWMMDEDIQSATWEWDNVCASEEWKVSHNFKHHTWTNVLGKDPDVGYGMLRVSPEQRWKPYYLGQPIYALILAVFFEWAIAIQGLELGRVFSGKTSLRQIRSQVILTVRKMGAQIMKDYVLWPLLVVALTLPLAFSGSGPAWLAVFLWVLAANGAANLFRNFWTYLIIFCGHFPGDVYVFTKQQVEDETRARWYVRQLLASCNISGGKLFHFLSGNLSHQIEHHLFPDLPSNRYQELAPRVRAMADRFELPYNTGSLVRQFGSTVWKILRLSFPGGASLGMTWEFKTWNEQQESTEI